MVDVSGWVLLLLFFGTTGHIRVDFQDIDILVHPILVFFDIAATWEV